MELIISIPVLIVLIALCRKKSTIKIKYNIKGYHKILLTIYVVLIIINILYYVLGYLPKFTNINYGFYIKPNIDSFMFYLSIFNFILIPTYIFIIKDGKDKKTIKSNIILSLFIFPFYCINILIYIFIISIFNPTTIVTIDSKITYENGDIYEYSCSLDNDCGTTTYKSNSPFTMKR